MTTTTTAVSVLLVRAAVLPISHNGASHISSGVCAAAAVGVVASGKLAPVSLSTPRSTAHRIALPSRRWLLLLVETNKEHSHPAQRMKFARIDGSCLLFGFLI